MMCEIWKTCYDSIDIHRRKTAWMHEVEDVNIFCYLKKHMIVGSIMNLMQKEQVYQSIIVISMQICLVQPLQVSILISKNENWTKTLKCAQQKNDGKMRIITHWIFCFFSMFWKIRIIGDQFYSKGFWAVLQTFWVCLFLHVIIF